MGTHQNLLKNKLFAGSLQLYHSIPAKNPGQTLFNIIVKNSTFLLLLKKKKIILSE